MVEYVFINNKKAKSNVKIILMSNATANIEEPNLKAAIKEQKFTGKMGEMVELYDGKTKLIAVGMGDKPSELDIQITGGKLIKKLNKDESASVILKDFPKSKISIEQTAFNLALGMELGGYRFDKYFTKKKDDYYPKTEKIEFISPKSKFDTGGYAKYQAVGNAVRYARDLANEPANYLNPITFAEDIKRLEYLGLKVEILDEKKIKSANMGALLSVAQGSANLPRVAIIKWTPNTKSKQFDLALVGKGVTFDSGGISIKPSANMGDMKGDMTGAAVVSATLKAAALQKLNKNVIGIVGLVENMPSGTATRPSDVVTSMSGQTIEVLNTDAEGRMVLADCLWYLQEKFEVDTIIDIATLTGSTMMTFGFEYAGLFSNNDKLSNDLMKSGETSGEKLWRLPLNSEYDKMVDSPIADMQNTGGRFAGGITAACFLQRFVKEGKKWAHLDIAGVDKDDKGHPLTTKGATGFGVRVLLDYLNK